MKRSFVCESHQTVWTIELDLETKRIVVISNNPHERSDSADGFHIWALVRQSLMLRVPLAGSGDPNNPVFFTGGYDQHPRSDRAVVRFLSEHVTPAGCAIDGFQFRYGAQIISNGVVQEMIGFGGAIELPEGGIDAVTKDHVRISEIIPDDLKFFREIT